MDIGGREPSKGAEEVGMDDEDTGTGGYQLTGIGDIFQGGTGGSFIMVRDVRADPLHRIGPEKFPA